MLLKSCAMTSVPRTRRCDEPCAVSSELAPRSPWSPTVTAMCFEIDESMSPLENFQNFMLDLEYLEGSVPTDTDPKAAKFFSTISEFTERLVTSASRFQPEGQISTIELLDSFIPIEEKARAKFLKSPIAQRALEMMLLKRVNGYVIDYITRVYEIIGVVRSFELHGSAATYVSEMAELFFARKRPRCFHAGPIGTRRNASRFHGCGKSTCAV